MERYEGRRGIIEVEEIGGQKVAKKSAKDKTKTGAINKEIQILKFLEKKGISFVPKVLDSGNGWFRYKRIEGEHLKEKIKTKNKDHRKILISQLLERAYTLDTLGVVHGEFIRPFTNMLVDSNCDLNHSKGNSISIIDFERGKIGDFSGKNMRSLSQRLAAESYISLNDCKKIGKMERNKMYTYISGKLEKKHHKQDITYSLNTVFFSLSLGSLVFLDQITKYFFYNLTRGSQWWLFTPALNTGIGRSIPVPLAVVNILTILIIITIMRAWRKKYFGSRTTVFLLSGAIGNFIDRIYLNGVRDFIDLQYRPIFNLADVYLTIAMGLILYLHIIKNDQ